MPKRKADAAATEATCSCTEESPAPDATEKTVKAKKEKKEKKDKKDKKEKKEGKQKADDPPQAQPQQVPSEATPPTASAVPEEKPDDKKSKKEKEKKEKKEKTEKKEKKGKAAIDLFPDEKPGPVSAPQALVPPKTSEVSAEPPQLPVAKKGKVKEKKPKEKKDDKKSKKSKEPAKEADEAAEEPQNSSKSVERPEFEDVADEKPEDFWRGFGLTDGPEPTAEEDHVPNTEVPAAAEAEAEDLLPETTEPQKGFEEEQQDIAAKAAAREAQRRENMRKAQEEAEAEEARIEMEPIGPRTLQLNREEVKALRENNEELLVLLRRISSDAVFTLEDNGQLTLSSMMPQSARHAELCVRALLGNETGSALELRAFPQEGPNSTVKDLPNASVIEMPASAAGAIDVKDLRRFGDVIATFVRQKDRAYAASAMTPAELEVSKQLGISVGEAVEVRHGDDTQWFHATVRGFTENGAVEVDWYRTDGSSHLGEGPEAEIPAVDIRASVCPRPPVVVKSGKLLLLGEHRARLSARLYAAVLAERRATATGAAPGLGKTMAESLLNLSEERSPDEDLDFAVVSVQLAPESRSAGWSERVSKVAKVSEAVLEVLPGGRKAILGGDMEERRRARSLLDLLPKVGPFGDIPTIPSELEDWSSHLRVPKVAVQAVRDTLQKMDQDSGVLGFWLPPNSAAPRRRDEAWQPGTLLEAQYRGSWHSAKLIARLEETAQITWDYDGSQDEVSLEQVRLRSVATRAEHLRTARVLVLVGPERCRVRAALAAMAATETSVPGLWTGEDAPKEEANVEICDGLPQDDSPLALEIVTLPSGELDTGWLQSNGGIQALRTVEEAAYCALQLLRGSAGATLLLAGSQIERERAQEYLTWAQKSRQSVEKRPHGLRGGGALSVMDADMRDDVLLVLLPEEQALRLSSERLAAIERETGTLLVFDKGGGSALPQGIRRLLVCGSSDLRRAHAASQARRMGESQAQDRPAATPASQMRSSAWDVLATIPWPQSINEWGRLQKQIWVGYPKLKPGYVRCMSKTHKREYYVRIADSTTTFDECEALA